jgi:hypothetical protein
MPQKGRQSNYKQELARPAYSMYDAIKSRRYKQDTRLRAQRVSEMSDLGAGHCRPKRRSPVRDHFLLYRKMV